MVQQSIRLSTIEARAIEIVSKANVQNNGKRKMSLRAVRAQLAWWHASHSIRVIADSVHA